MTQKSQALFKAAPSMALSDSGGTIRRITARSRHLEKMNVVRTQREPAGRYAKG